MVPMVGQDNLLKKINSYTLETLPRQLMLIGEEGCGKHSLAINLAEMLNLPLVNISVEDDNDKLIEYRQDPINKMYLINLKDYTEKQQNSILKLIEEPSIHMYLVLITESEIGVLNTVLNRCIKYHFEQYTEEELQRVNWINTNVNPLIYKICRTPGQVVKATSEEVNFDKLYNTCSLISTKLDQISYEYLLSITADIRCKEVSKNLKAEEKAKKMERYLKQLDFSLFFTVLLYVAFENYKCTNNEMSLRVYLTASKFKQELIGKNIVKENFMLNFFSRLWNEAR